MNNKDIMKKILTSKTYWMGALLAIHGYDTIRAIAMMHQKPKSESG